MAFQHRVLDRKIVNGYQRLILTPHNELSRGFISLELAVDATWVPLPTGLIPPPSSDGLTKKCVLT